MIFRRLENAFVVSLIPPSVITDYVAEGLRKQITHFNVIIEKKIPRTWKWHQQSYPLFFRRYVVAF